MFLYGWKRRLNKAGILLFLPVFLFIYSSKAQFRFIAETDVKKISQNDYISLQYIIYHDGPVRQFIPPRFRSFRIIKGPEQYTSRNPNQAEPSQYTTFRYILSPLKTGNLEIPSATVLLDSGKYQSHPIYVEVVPSYSPPVAQASPGIHQIPEEFLLEKGASIQEKIKNNLFVKLDVDKTNCFIGEPVVATYKLYTRLKSESRVVKRPGFSGFSVVDMADIESEIPVKEKYHGREYNVYLLRKVQLYPLQTGKFDLETVEVLNSITFVNAALVDRGYNLSNLVDAFIEDRSPAGTTIQENVTLSSTPVTIEVNPLPAAGRPPVFTGAVGSFELQAKVDKDHLRVNDVANLELRLKGKGNFSMIGMPVVHWPDSVETFVPVTTESLNKYLSPLSGSKVFTIPFSPKTEGWCVIPSVSLNYFDPATKKYRRATTDSIRLMVEGAGDSGDFLSEIPTYRTTNGNHSVPFVTILLILSATVVFGVLWFVVRKRMNPESKEEKTESAANTILPAEMSEPENQPRFLAEAVSPLKDSLQKGEVKTFYHLLEKALLDMVEYNYEIPSKSDLHTICLTLKRNGWNDEEVEDFYRSMEDCEMALYTPVGMEEKMEGNLQRVLRLLVKEPEL